MAKSKVATDGTVAEGNDLFMSADSAAGELGVTLGTLYSYVSRKNIRTKQVEGTRQRLYWRADIARVKESLWKRAEAPQILRNDSDITLLTSQGPYYRGQNAIRLSDEFTLEQTAALLWQVDEKEVFSGYLPHIPPELKSLNEIWSDALSTDKAIALLPFLENANPRAFDMSQKGMCRTGVDVLRWYAAIVTDSDRPSDEPLHLQIGDKLGGSFEVADLVRRVLVLSADHGFGAGTYAVRAVASTGVSGYRSVLAGLAITSGRRSRLGRAASISRLLSEIEAGTDGSTVIIRRLREGESIPGFDSPAPYVGTDPRADAILAHLTKMYGRTPTLKKFIQATDTIADIMGTHPSFAIMNLLFTRLVGCPENRYIYVLGRCAGWIAHSIEQYEMGEIETPSLIYRGALP